MYIYMVLRKVRNNEVPQKESVEMKDGYTFIDLVMAMVLVSIVLALIVFKAADNSIKTNTLRDYAKVACATSAVN
ncbi:MAG: hypothetical protein ABIJ27_02575 [Candidatus Omnitrophota bacterium]